MLFRSELRQLDGTRTALAVVGALGALAWLIFGTVDLDTDPPTLTNPPPPEPLESRIPIIGRGRMGP